MKKAVVYIHGKNGSAFEAERYKKPFDGYDVVGLDYKTNTPWDTGREIEDAVAQIKDSHDEIILIANSIGAFFSMNADIGDCIDRAYFISPIVDMQKLITDMMAWAGVAESELKEKGEIPTSFGETLSWEYLSYVKDHPIKWTVPTDILYGDKDGLTSMDTVTAFSKAHGARLTVMRGGEHWFHTDEQLRFLDDWITKSLL